MKRSDRIDIPLDFHDFYCGYGVPEDQKIVSHNRGIVDILWNYISYSSQDLVTGIQEPISR
jgi:hypothetical protein